MTINFGSSEDVDFIIDGDAGSTTSTSGSKIDTNYVRTSLRTNGAGYVKAVADAASATLYMTCRYYQNSPHNASGSNNVIIIREGATNVAKIRCGSGIWSLQTWDGGWVNRVNFSNNLPSLTRTKLSIKLSLHASTGEFTAWIGDIVTATWSGDTIGDTGATGVDTIEFKDSNNYFTSNGDAYWSEVVIADEPTINMRVASLVPNADGANTAWTNTYTAVDEAVESVGDTLKSPTANQIETMGLSNYGGGSSLVVKTLFVSSKAIRDSGGPQQLQAAVRVSTTEYFSSTIAVSTVYANYRKKWATNPFTAADWTLTDIDALEAGIKSIA